ncbi:hypothetical protein Goari_002846 [Gossypium aridum]|uniref:Pentatricopeptide repeat-containing protein n=1 Tax=Gossypium aridum TaxID=34290 RepID=A0A7J8Y9Q6_GOSAI|nr:hypothetical protein [Gossypium aridum]
MACAKLGILKLERIFHEFSVNGLKPDVYTYVIMINGFCKEGLPDEAYQLFRSMGDNDCLPDRRCYNVLSRGFFETVTPQRQHNFLSIWSVRVSLQIYAPPSY